MSKQGGLTEDQNYLGKSPFGTTATDGSQGDKGVAGEANKEFEGDSSENKKFEGIKSHLACSAKQMENSGHD
jgi:hypothetical protein